MFELGTTKLENEHVPRASDTIGDAMAHTRQRITHATCRFTEGVLIAPISAKVKLLYKKIREKAEP